MNYSLQHLLISTKNPNASLRLIQNITNSEPKHNSIITTFSVMPIVNQQCKNTWPDKMCVSAAADATYSTYCYSTYIV